METATKVFEPRMPRRHTPKKRIVITVVAAVLAVALIVGLVLFLIPRPAAVSYDGIVVDSEMYAFWYSMLKTEMIARYFQDGTTTNKDKAENWDKKCTVEGKTDMTWGEFFDEEIRRAIKIKLVASRLYDELGLEMADNQRNAINTYYKEMLAYAADDDGGKMRELLTTYKTSEAAMRRCAVLDMKVELLYHHLAYYGDAAIEEGDTREGFYLTAAEMNTYYKEHYLRAKIVYINESVYATIENGVRVEKPLNTIDGVGARNDLDMAELEEYFLTGKPIDAATFEAYVARSDEALHEAYPNGIFYTLSSDLKGVTGLTTQDLISATPGKLMKAETGDGVCYILGYETKTGDYRDEKNADFFADFYEKVADVAVTERAEARLGEVTEFPENFKDIDVYTVPYNKHFKYCSVS